MSKWVWEIEDSGKMAMDREGWKRIVEQDGTHKE
jgi:hypothetical protein